MTSEAPLDGLGSPERFGFAWDKYSELIPEYETQFRRWAVHLPPEEWAGKTFLDVGCGMGRNSFWPIKYGAASGVGIDIDDRSLASARNTLNGLPVEVRKLSAYDIDYRDHFDITFSIGVIHHLSNPEIALSRMVAATKPGGRMLIWVYGLENNQWVVTFLDPLRKALFGWMPIKLVFALSIIPTAAIWLLLRLGLRPTEYFRLIAGFKFWHLRSIVFDQMLPKIAGYWPRSHVEKLMGDAGLNEVKLAWVNENSWSAIGTKPL
ncbi:Class I SAM-dependent methyltransferase [uncultured Gammaproteobacteria bacterium]